jgi:predicted membrane protein
LAQPSGQPSGGRWEEKQQRITPAGGGQLYNKALTIANAQLSKDAEFGVLEPEEKQNRLIEMVQPP